MDFSSSHGVSANTPGERTEWQFLYKSGDKFVLMSNQTYDQIEISASVIGSAADFIKEGLEGIVLHIAFGRERIVSLQFPLVQLKVVELISEGIEYAPTIAEQFAVLETGAKVRVPISVKIGQTLVIDPNFGKFVRSLADQSI